MAVDEFDWSNLYDSIRKAVRKQSCERTPTRKEDSEAWKVFMRKLS